MKVIKVLLVEDHPQMCVALSSILAQDFEVLGIVGRGDEVLEAAERLQPDAVVLDVSLPGRSGMKVLPELRSLLPDAAIVMMTAHDDAVYRDTAMRLGADAFLSKHSAPKLLEVVRSASEWVPS